MQDLSDSDDTESKDLSPRGTNATSDDFLKTKREPTAEELSLPWKQVIPLVLLQVCESFNSSSIFSYVTFLVQDFSDEDRDSAGKWAGIIASAVYAGAFCSSYLWGRLSDRFGKRICLIAGSIGTLICTLAFGFTWSIWWAAVTRYLAGVLNGNLGVAKSYLGLITNQHNQAKAFGLIAVAWGGGAMLGSSIGGFTARPAISWPGVFSPDGLFGKFPYLLPNLIASSVLICGLLGAYFFLPEPEVNGSKNNRSSSDELPSVWRQTQPLLACGAYMGLGFCFILFEETMPLWFTSEVRSGGLAFSPPQIGIFMAVLGASFLFIQLVVYSYIPAVLGLIYTHRAGILMMLPVVLLTPLINLLHRDTVQVWVALTAVCLGQALADSCAFAAVMVLITNSVDPRQFGEANGIGQTGVALVRALGPAIGGQMFAWSLQPGRTYPFNHWFVFLFQAFMLFLLFLFSFTLSHDLNRPKVTDDEYPIQEVRTDSDEELLARDGIQGGGSETETDSSLENVQEKESDE